MKIGYEVIEKGKPCLSLDIDGERINEEIRRVTCAAATAASGCDAVTLSLLTDALLQPPAIDSIDALLVQQCSHLLT